MTTLSVAAPHAATDHHPAARAAAGSALHVMTIDVEDWFHVTNFEPVIRRHDWPACPSRLQETVPRLLDLLAEYQARATFFTLGWVARRFPGLVRRIAEAGHELATHGDEHRLLTCQSPVEFRQQLVRSQEAIEQASGARVEGHRAPSYSYRKRTEWMVQVLLESGLRYDSSVFPFGPRKDPQLHESRLPYALDALTVGTLMEYPLSVVGMLGLDLPIAGGGYFRLLPYDMVKFGIQRLDRRGVRAIMYLHPWEIDPDQPRVAKASWLAKFRHYHHLDRTEGKFRQLLRDFRFGSIRDVFWSPTTQCYEAAPQH